MTTHQEKLIAAFSNPKNHSELLLKVNQLSKLPQNYKSRNELMCKKCLIPWSHGKFTLTVTPSNRHRKKRRQHQIERLQQLIKSKKISKADVVKLTRKLKRLQQQNNHIALYKCFCKTVTKVQLRKKAIITNKIPTVDVKTMNEKKKDTEEQRGGKQITNEQADVTIMKKIKKRKTAGLNIPINHNNTKSTSSSSSTMKLSQLSDFLQKQKNSEGIKKSKLNQFLK